MSSRSVGGGPNREHSITAYQTSPAQGSRTGIENLIFAVIPSGVGFAD